jgi:hypothetical protein
MPVVPDCAPHEVVAAAVHGIACAAVAVATRPQSWLVKAIHAKDVAALAVKRPVTAMPTTLAIVAEPQRSEVDMPPEVNCSSLRPALEVNGGKFATRKAGKLRMTPLQSLDDGVPSVPHHTCPT